MFLESRFSKQIAETSRGESAATHPPSLTTFLIRVESLAGRPEMILVHGRPRGIGIAWFRRKGHSQLVFLGIGGYETMATVRINDVRIDYNIWMNGINGMIIHTGFDVLGLAQVLEIGAYFNFWNGGPLRDMNNAYKTENGNVYVGVSFNPNFVAMSYPDFQLFMPYDELHMGPGNFALMCLIVVWDRSQVVPQKLANSVWIPFNYSS